MFPKDLVRHAADFARQFRRHKYEHKENGDVWFNQAKVSIGGRFIHEDGTSDPNTWTNEGMNYLFNVGLRTGVREAGICFAPWGNNMNPTRLLTAATFPALAGEFVNPADGYTEANRQPWVSDAPALGEGSNGTDIQYITIATATAAPGSFITIRGNALVTRSAKGSTDGVLLSISRYANDRQAFHGDSFPMKYVLSMLP